jgi:hypothetical protein
MSNLKPLIFVHPLQETLKELMKIMKESAEQDGIEVHEVDSVQEFTQLFATVGQSVCLFGNPRKCAQDLQLIKKVNKKLHSKILLLSQKTIPRKTLEKFEKIGLTEAIIEPVAPKTLHYKVRLQLKSIITKAEQEEMNRKFGSDENAAKDNVNNEGLNKNKNNEQEDDASLSKKSSYHEDAISGHMKGKVTNPLSSEEETESDSHSQVDHIEKYMRGMSNGESSLAEDSTEDNESLELDHDDLISDIKESLSLELEEELENTEREKIKQFEKELEQKKKAQKKLALEQAREEKKKKAQSNRIDNRMRGTLNPGSACNEDEDKVEQSTDKHDVIVEPTAPPKKKGPNVENETDIIAPSKPVHVEKENQTSKGQGYHDVIDDSLTGKSDFREQVNESTVNEAGVEQIETMIKGRLDHTRDESPQEESRQREKVQALAELSEATNNAVSVEPNIDDSHIDEQFDNENEAPIVDELNSDEMATDRGSKPADRQERTRGSYNEVIDNEVSKSSAAITPGPEFYKRANANNNADESDGHYSGNSQSSVKKKKANDLIGESYTDQKKEKSNRADARADHIETHYKSGGLSHQADAYDDKYKRTPRDQDLGGFGPKETRSHTAQEKSRGEGDTFDYSSEKKKSFYEHEGSKQSGDAGTLSGGSEALGEQTIDYDQLHKEFFGLDDVDLETITSEEYIYQDETLESVDIDELIVDELEDIAPSPQGLEVLIELAEYAIGENPSLRHACDIVNSAAIINFQASLSVYLLSDESWMEFYPISQPLQDQKLIGLLNIRGPHVQLINELWSYIVPYTRGQIVIGVAILQLDPNVASKFGQLDKACLEMHLEGLKGFVIDTLAPPQQEKPAGTLSRLFGRRAS